MTRNQEIAFRTGMSLDKKEVNNFQKWLDSLTKEEIVTWNKILYKNDYSSKLLIEIFTKIIYKKEAKGKRSYKESLKIELSDRFRLGLQLQLMKVKNLKLKDVALSLT